MKEKPVDERDAFSRKMIDILNAGALNLAMAIGYRTGLYDVLDTFDVPQPLSSIAQKSGLNARYVKEWLGIMVTGGIIEVSEGENGQSLFHLPKAHADFITRRANDSNLGVYTQEIPLLTSCALEPVVESFRSGAGIGYDHYPAFQAFMSELADAKHEQVLVDKFLPSVDDGRLVRRLHNGILACDLGCAEGVALLLMAKAFPKSQFIGIDISAEAIREARAKAESQGVSNVRWLVRDAAAIVKSGEFRGCFDYVTAFDAIHDQSRPLKALQGVHAMLAEKGCFSMVDIAARTRLEDNLGHPMGPFLYTVSLMHCMPVGLVENGTGLGMMWGQEKAVEMLRQAGFQNVEVLAIPDDPFNLHFFCRK